MKFKERVETKKWYFTTLAEHYLHNSNKKVDGLCLPRCTYPRQGLKRFKVHIRHTCIWAKNRRNHTTTYRFWSVCRSSYYSLDDWCYFKRFKAHFRLRIIGSKIPTVELRHIVFISDLSQAQGTVAPVLHDPRTCVGVTWVFRVGAHQKDLIYDLLQSFHTELTSFYLL